MIDWREAFQQTTFFKPLGLGFLTTRFLLAGLTKFFLLHVLEPSIAADGISPIAKDVVGKIICIFILFCIFWFCLEYAQTFLAIISSDSVTI